MSINLVDRIRIDSNRFHGRAISKEIGERLLILMRRKPSQLSVRLQMLEKLAKADARLPRL